MMMKKTRADFIKQVKADNAAIGKANARIEKQIVRLYKDWRNQIKALVRDPDLFTDSQKFDLAVATETITGLSKQLDDMGRDDLVAAYIDEFDPLKKQAQEYFKQFGKTPKLGGTSEEAFDAYIDFSSNRLVQTLEARLVAPIQEGLFHATFGTMPRDTVVDTVLSIADNFSERQAVTLVDDTLRQYQRGVTNMAGEAAGLEVWWYQGPDDAITSPQCEFILNDTPHEVEGMYYRDEISIDMHEDLKDDPFIAGGHFNCRHKFYPITLEFAESMGFKA